MTPAVGNPRKSFGFYLPKGLKQRQWQSVLCFVFQILEGLTLSDHQITLLQTWWWWSLNHLEARACSPARFGQTRAVSEIRPADPTGLNWL